MAERGTCKMQNKMKTKYTETKWNQFEHIGRPREPGYLDQWTLLTRLGTPWSVNTSWARNDLAYFPSTCPRSTFCARTSEGFGNQCTLDQWTILTRLGTLDRWTLLTKTVRLLIKAKNAWSSPAPKPSDWASTSESFGNQDTLGRWTLPTLLRKNT